MHGAWIAKKKCDCCGQVVYQSTDCMGNSGAPYFTSAARDAFVATGKARFIYNDDLYHFGLGSAVVQEPGMVIIDDIVDIEPTDLACSCSNALTPNESPVFIVDQKIRVVSITYAFENIEPWDEPPAAGCVPLGAASRRMWQNDLVAGSFDKTFVETAAEGEYLCSFGSGSAPRQCHPPIQYTTYFSPACSPTGTSSTSQRNASSIYSPGGSLGFNVVQRSYSDGGCTAYDTNRGDSSTILLSFGCTVDVYDLYDPDVTEVVYPNEITEFQQDFGGSGTSIGKNGQVRITFEREAAW